MKCDLVFFCFFSLKFDCRFYQSYPDSPSSQRVFPMADRFGVVPQQEIGPNGAGDNGFRPQDLQILPALAALPADDEEIEDGDNDA